MSERFYISTPIESDFATLAGPEAHHLTNVLRAKVGDIVTLFDGLGSEFSARISKIGKQAVEFIVEQRQTIDRESPISLTLAVALPKGDRQRWMIEKAVELGVSRIIPLFTERGVAQPVDSALERLRRGVIEASKQCGRNRLMEVAEPCRLDELVACTQSIPLRLVAHPGGLSIQNACPAAAEMSQIVAAVGPEGGFADAEVGQLLAAGWTAVSLGPRILRIETAAIAVAAWASLGETHPR